MTGWTDGGGHGRKTHPARHRCGAPVLTGLDADRAALQVTVDPAPLTAIGEAAALILGRQTYELHTAGDRQELDYRDRHRITARPANLEKSHVVQAHECGKPPIATKPQTDTETEGADNDRPGY